MASKEFWHESLTGESWKKLQEFSKETGIIVIGGWSVWLWTQQHKSRDIDIIVGFEGLARLKEKYVLEKNEKLKKYEIKLQGFDIDIYVPFYSKLAIPIEDLLKQKTKIHGINTVSCESLLILKQQAEIDRRNTVKGQKDTIDILSILFYGPVNFKKYSGLLETYRKKEFKKELATEIMQFHPKDSEKYLGLKYNEFIKKKKETLAQIKKI